MQLRIDNEYDRLEAVMVRRPGREIERLTHENMHEYLFEDAPFLRRMQEEHDKFVAVMRERGTTVLDLTDLLLEIVQDDDVRGSLIEHVCHTAMVPAITDELAAARHWGHPELIDLLFTGLTAAEFHEMTGRRVAPLAGGDNFLLPPIPNSYFMRDPAVTVRDAAISCKMHYRQRIRESVLVRAVLENHPEFRDSAITYGGSDEPTEDRPFTIEGGDVIILSPEAVLVGASERTRSETIELLADKCFKFGHVKRVYEVPIPAERSFMHLDTVFTVIDRGVVLWYAPVMENIRYVHRYEPAESPGETTVRRIPEQRSFADMLRAEFDTELTIIDTAGGHDHFGKREQRNDATNALAIAPRTVITYERNERTIQALQESGVTCIGIDDSELVRGLGGPRCMTMPLRRALA